MGKRRFNTIIYGVFKLFYFKVDTWDVDLPFNIFCRKLTVFEPCLYKTVLARKIFL